jgi:hypothetical protein
MENIMHKSTLGLALATCLLILGSSPAAFAGQTTTRTGPYGRTQTVNRSAGNGQQTTVRTGPYGRSRVTNRSVGNGQQVTTRTGPYGRTQTTTRTLSQ